MTDKTLYTLPLNGQEVTLKFNNGMMKRLKNLLGKDPMNVLSDLEPVEAIVLAENIVKAGILAHQRSDDYKSVDWVTAACDDLGPQDSAEIIKRWTRAISPDTAPEGGKDTQSGEATDV